MDTLTKEEAQLATTVLALRLSKVKRQTSPGSPTYKAQVPLIMSAMRKLDAVAKAEAA